MSLNRVWGVAVLALVLPTIAGAQSAELPEGVTQEMVEQGATIYAGAGLCQTCHGAEGVGTPLAPSLADDTWLHIEGGYEEIVELINAGVPEPKEAMIPMVPKGGSQISEDEVRAVAAYVWTLARGS